ncbi:uncharacterized protein I303_106329 [Kwoniella dejecticola CBS 10117]|uniref:alpha-1,6-mannosyl-glycoprotein 6-beta-N-acetylglucosaminyltransferase n=1 Tax=Kwoniella dejecticola CBS 10117 TaxID=1296121 RepID=A0A1A5ZV12_9TREE|nr:uncharacterized protein I303_08414 [Kwoniella dejecticola CBS 10117]OBR81643.1 hypothetical protein I303_08414 [Kwoniella dejecticola CBS 10117]
MLPSLRLKKATFLSLAGLSAFFVIEGLHILDVGIETYILPSSWQDDPPALLAALKGQYGNEQALAWEQQQYVAKVESAFPPYPDWGGSLHGREDYKYHSEKELRKLAVCTATDTCAQNQSSVIILGHIYNHFHIYDHYLGGEGIWTASLVETLTKWGYTILHARDDWVYMWYLYNQIPGLVKGIIAWPTGQYGTFEDQMKTGWRANGIPAWQFFVYNYFPGHYTSIVGDAWNMHSELGFVHERQNFTFIPYVVERATSPPYVPTVQRPNQIYILAKFLRYFYPGSHPAWEDTGIFQRAKEILQVEFPGLEFVVGCRDDRDELSQQQTPLELPVGVRNLGYMSRAEFEAQLANSRVMLGIGWPTLSPSPHVALSLGIPFVNPFTLYGNSDPNDPETWATSQHYTLAALGEPYVYNVLYNNETGFIDALRKALSTPIEPFILPFMTREHHERQLSEWLNTDWKDKAAAILDNRKHGRETEHGTEIREFTL